MRLLKGLIDKDDDAATTLIVRTDAHSGLRLGLQNPETELWEEDEEGNLAPRKPELTATQKWLWELYSAHVTEAIQWSDNDEIVLFDLGDACQGDKHHSRVVSVRDADQVELALGTFDLFIPYADRIRSLRLLVGTDAHNFGFGSAEIALMARLKNTFPKTHVKLVRHGLFTVAGVAVDTAHHGPSGGSRKWLEGNIVRFYLKDLMLSSLIAWEAPPRLVLRAHHHVEMREEVTVYTKAGRMWQSVIHLCPPYSGVTHYATKVTRSKSTLTVGLLVFRLRNGIIESWDRFTETIDLRTKEPL
jgi:hypothetical protein